MPDLKTDDRGLLWGFVSYCLWGFFPIYWKLLIDRPPVEILVHRMVWSFAFYLSMYMLFSERRIADLFRQSQRDWLLSALASLLLAINWGLYIYAVNTGHILEGSLAYFINPILNVAVGVLFFREPFPVVLKFSVLFATLGVLAKIVSATSFPWISLVLAFSFCAYGVVKKLLKTAALTSSVLEGAIGLVPASIAVTYFQMTNSQPTPPSTLVLFILGGVVTGLPLFLFSFAAQRISYSIMGMLQFIAPSLQFLVGLWMFHEPFALRDALSFGLIWIGIAFYLTFQFLNRGGR